MECVACKNPLNPDAKRCMKCGTNVQEPIISKPVVKKVVEVKPIIKKEAKKIVDKLFKKKK
jgi:uncharacterized protein with PIN domain